MFMGSPSSSDWYPILTAIRAGGRNQRTRRYGRTMPEAPRADVELLVVGAGPAGIATALEARALGVDVLVVDKAAFPRDKTCGDGLTARALRLLERFGLDVRTLPSHAPV